MRLLVLAVCALAVTAPAIAQTTAPWDYQGKRGELNWGKLDPAYRACSKGREQSPIDIRNAHLDKALAPLDFDYLGGPVTLTNDGHTIVAHVDPGSYMVSGGVRYDLVEFDFHHPSETAVRGKLTGMDVHLLHKSADGKMAILVVRLREDMDAPNAVLAALWPHLPATAGTTVKVKEMVDAGGLLPADRGYWTYMGSLDTPPCTEGVRWFVFEDELSLSRDQMRAFASIFPMNTRGLQDAHGRRIEANE